MKKNPKDYLIVALDVSSSKEAVEIINELDEEISFYKIGLELFSGTGFEIIKEMKNRGKKIFFDGKFFDIPNTVYKAVSNIVQLNIDILNIHISGGEEMMTKAKEAVNVTAENLKIIPPKLIGVTVLTSSEENKEKILEKAIEAKKANLDGVVCSAQEAKIIKEKLGKDFLVVTPGIRPEWACKNDQKRIMTPKNAILNGADYIVVGRPITASSTLKDSAKKVILEIEEAITALKV